MQTQANLHVRDDDEWIVRDCLGSVTLRVVDGRDDYSGVTLFLGEGTGAEATESARRQLAKLAAAIGAAWHVLDDARSTPTGPDDPDDEPGDEPATFDPGPEVDDEGGMSEHRFVTDAEPIYLAGHRIDPDDEPGDEPTAPTFAADEDDQPGGYLVDRQALGWPSTIRLVARECAADGCDRPARDGLTFCLVHDDRDPASPTYDPATLLAEAVDAAARRPELPDPAPSSPVVAAEPWGVGDGDRVAVFAQAHPMTEAELRVLDGNR